MLKPGKTYDEVFDTFRWEIPEHYNIGVDRGKKVFDLTINEFYGQTEANLVVGNCSLIMDNVPGSMGKAVPGHTLAVLDDAGQPVSPDTVGKVAIQRPDPVMFLA